MTEPENTDEPDEQDQHLITAVRGLGPEREPDEAAHQRAAQIDPSEWHSMRGPDDDPDA